MFLWSLGKLVGMEMVEKNNYGLAFVTSSLAGSAETERRTLEIAIAVANDIYILSDRRECDFG